MTDDTSNTLASRGTSRGTPKAARQVAAVALTLLLAGAAAAPAAVALDTGHAPVRTSEWGTLVSVEPVATLDRAAVTRRLADVDMPVDTVRYGVTAYRLTYRTPDAYGRPTTATGLFTLPNGGAHRPDLVSDTHGTMVDRDYAPSVADDFGRVPSYLYAATGNAVAASDYLGLGKGPGTHPYMDTASSVTASLDMLRAAREAAHRLGRPLTGDVYATGFSQGGQVATALGKALQDGADRHFRLRALAPVSGPYDLSGQEIPALYDGRVNDTSGLIYTSYFLVAQNRLHGLYKDPSEAFRAPYADRVEALYDGDHTEEDIIKALPASAKELLTPKFYAWLRHPTGAMKEAVAANDTACAWQPDVPVRLYAGEADTDVPIGNARSCARQLGGAPVLDQGEVDHFGSFKKAAPKIARWFAER
ncbi:alpha/beta hydrolase [Streptomyces sp. VRA16 Mangrove soil]|uniref:alpha/beta hydrolase n=1 Tax=Streptomyces sp. VRA16 Mangrove soil TaxID=2817434 RepID=UPI001A9F33AD|nr:alpha/beta hydrolase [Streptomyces sp. VRA16 Mangrove soil]MBO1333135.1 alpha/beta hydrolase [Streptomyces sp. VRA16 Mangrove soil]